MKTDPLLLSTKKAAARLGISTWTLKRERRLGRIDGIQIGRRWFFRVGDVDAMAMTTREKRALQAAASGPVN
jgi:predicted site-specific integrase-resolvase